MKNKPISLWTNLKPHIVLLLLLGLLAAAFLAPALRPGYTLVPPVPGDRYPWQGTNNPAPYDPHPDVLLLFYPFRHFFTETLRRGELPLWNPYIFSGYPLQGDVIAQPFYPLNWLMAYFFSAPRALSFGAFIHMWLAGAFVYGYVHLITSRRFGAFASALTFMFSGVFTMWITHPQFYSTSVWTAAILFFYELALRRKRALYAAVAGLCIGIQILGGQSQYFLYSSLLVAGYVILSVIRHDRPRRFAYTALMGAIGLGSGAVQLLPAFELASFSHRAAMSYSKLAEVHFPWRHLVTYIAPNFYGTPADGTFWGDITYIECMAYFGVLPLLLALIAPFVARHKYTYFFYGAGIVTLLIGLGTPLMRIAYLVPGFSLFHPQRIVYIVAVCGAILTGLAVEELRERCANTQIGAVAVLFLAIAVGAAYLVQRPPHAARYVLPALVLLLFAYAVLYIYTKYHAHRAAQVLLVAFIMVDLGAFGFGYNRVTPISELYPATALIDELARQSSVSRTMLFQPRGAVLMGPNVPLVFRLHDTSGYTSTFVSRYQQFINGMESRANHLLGANTNTIVFDHAHSRLLQLLNVKYILAVDEPEPVVLPDIASALRCDAATESIWGTRTIGQDFTTAYAGLNRVDIQFTDVPRDGAGEIAFHLLPDATSSEHRAYVKIDIASIPESGVYSFYFAPQPDSANRQYHFFLDAPDITAETDAVGVCLVGDKLAFAAYSYPIAVWQKLGTYDGVTIYENPDYLPRAWVVHQARVVQDDEEILAALKSPAFNPATTVILEDENAPITASVTSAPPAASEITRYEATKIDLQVTTEEAGYLVLSEIYYPGWKAYVDGEPHPIYRANYTLRAIPIDAGAHEVQVRFEPLSFRLGAGISLVTLLSAAVISIVLHKYENGRLTINKRD